MTLKVHIDLGGLEVMNMSGRGLNSASERNAKACKEGKRDTLQSSTFQDDFLPIELWNYRILGPKI